MDCFMKEELSLKNLMDEEEKAEDDHLYDTTMRRLKSFIKEELICFCRFKGFDNVFFFFFLSFSML